MEIFWQDIAETNNLYQINNLGQIKRKRHSVARISHKNNASMVLKEKILKNQILNGYNACWIYCNGKSKCFYVHRLLAKYFLSNPLNYGYVNHKDNNRLNNNLDNLEWCSFQQNCFQKYKYKKNASSKYKGVSWSKRDKKWGSKIGFNNKTINIGFFSAEKEAALAYNEKAKELHGKFAVLNII